ncbi:MAG: GNAT family N-acetyltransferase [Alphaproteobacteria bacterium]|nr:GNAT family N-acetyltransferase [Alphaproteobacteria bacterium]
MQFEIIIKNSKLTDELLEILQKEWPEAYGWLTDVIDDWSISDFPQIVVATQNKEIIGYYSLVAKELVKDNHNYTPWLGTLFIREKYRGNHYSSILIDDVCQRVKNMGYSNLFLATEHIGYYEKFGFEEIGLGMYLWDAPTRFYRKSLT